MLKMLRWFKAHSQDTIIFVAGIIFAVLVSEFLEAKILYASTAFYFLLTSFLLLIVFYVTQLSLEVRDMVVALGTRVRYVGSQWQTESTRTGDVFEEVRKIIESAEYEILVVGYNDPYFDPSVQALARSVTNTDPSQQKRLGYLRTIERKLENVRDKPFEYTRIIQLPHTDNIHLQVALGPVEFNHCHNVLQIKHNCTTENLVANILTVRTERTLTFLIVDNKYLILANTGVKYTETGKVSYVAGVFIIEDYNSSLVNGFRRYFLGHLVPLAQPLTLGDFTSDHYPTAL